VLSAELPEVGVVGVLLVVVPLSQPASIREVPESNARRIRDVTRIRSAADAAVRD